MPDDFSLPYGDLLTGSYDCVDRIVLNAYFSLGHNQAASVSGGVSSTAAPMSNSTMPT